MEAIGTFLMDQVLKMQWLSDLIAGLLGAAGLDTASQWGGTLHFFIYDTIKIVILLCVTIFVISYIQSYFPPERSKRILGRFKGVGGNIAGALLGTVTPFCACSSIPLFIAFTRAGLPLGVTFSFRLVSLHGARSAAGKKPPAMRVRVEGSALASKRRQSGYDTGVQVVSARKGGRFGKQGTQPVAHEVDVQVPHRVHTEV